MISRNQLTGKRGLDWAGGIWGDIREVKEANEFNQDAVNHLNQTLKSNDFQNNYKSLIRNLVLEDEKTSAALQGDKHEVLNKQHEQFINDALQFIRADKYEDFLDNIKSLQNSDGDEVRRLFSIPGIKSIPFDMVNPTVNQKEYTDTFKGYTSDDIANKLDKNSKQLLTNAKTIHDLYNAFSTQYPEMSEDTKEKLIFTASKLENINQRINDINKESMSKFGIDINNHVKVKDREIDLSDYKKEYKRVVEDQLLNGTFNPVEAETFKDKVTDLPRLLANKIEYTDLYKQISTGKGILELEEQVKKEKDLKDKLDKEAGTYIPTIGDEVNYNNISHTIHSINEDGTYNLVDKNGEIQSNIPKDSVTYDLKKGHLDDQDSTEPLNEPDVPLGERKLNTMREKGLKEPASSLSTSHWDPKQQKTIVRNEEHNLYISNPSNKLEGDKVELHIDTELSGRKEIIWNKYKPLYNKLSKGEVLSPEEANKVLSDIRTINEEDPFESLVDLIPIKALHIASDGTKFDKGLYYHESGFDNIYVPQSIVKEGDNAVKDYIKSEMQKTRDNRKSILYALLTGKEVVIGIKGKTKGIPNNTGVNKKIDEVLKTPANKIKLGLGLNSNIIWTGHNSASMEGYGSAGNVFFETDKTANGEKTHLKANISKISKEHAEILWNSILTMYYPNGNGANSEYKGDEVEGLTVVEVINLLTYMGSRTNLSNPKNEGLLGQHLKDKQLFVDGNLVLHYGTKSVPLQGGIYSNSPEINIDEEKQKFIDWAIENKNYAVNKELPKMGIELNKPLKKKFKLGEWVSDGKDTYSGFLIKNGVVQTDVDEYKNTGSLFYAPVTILDLTSSALTIKPSIKEVKTNKTVQSKVTKSTEQKTTKPVNTGTSKVKVTESIPGSKYSKEELRSLSVGTIIYYSNTSKDSADVETTINKPIVEVVDKNGKKQYKVYPKGYDYFFNEETIDKLLTTLQKTSNIEVSDKSVESLFKLANTKKLGVTIDTSKSIDGVKKEVEQIQSNNVNEETTNATEATDQNPIDKIDLSNFSDGTEITFGDEVPTRLAYTPTIKYEVADINKELSWLNSKLGDIPIEVKEGLIELARTGKRAFGLLKDNTIILSNIAEKGTIYHEAFHKVSLLYLDNKQRESIYEEARNKYIKDLKDSSDYQVEEYLAEKFREFVISRESTSPKELTFLGKIGKFFNDLYEMVKNIFTGSKKLTDLDIDKLFESIQSSKFKTYKSSEENLKKLSGVEQPLEMRDKQLANILTYKQYKSVIRGLASVASSKVNQKLFDPSKTKYGVINIIESINDLELDNLKDVIKTKIDQFTKAANDTGNIVSSIQKGTLDKESSKILNEKYKTKNEQELSNLMSNLYDTNVKRMSLWQEVHDNYDNIFKEAVENYISNELGIKKIVDDSDDEASKELLRYDKASYEYSAKENITNSIKFLLSNLHVSPEVNQFTGLHEFVTIDEIWSRLMADLHSLDTIEDMISLLESKSDYFPYDQLAKKLKDKGSELLRTQFEVSFRKHRHAFINAMFNRAISDNGYTNYQFYFTDADIQKASNQIVRTWGEMFALSPIIEDNKINLSKLKSITKEFNDLQESYKDDLARKIVKELDPYKNRLVSLLNKLKIEVDNKTIDRLIEKIKKDKHIGTSEEGLKELLMGKKSLYHLFSEYSTLTKFAQSKDTDSVRKLELKNLFQNESIIKDLATAFAEVNPQDTSDMTLGPEGNPHYVYSDNTYITDVIKEITNGNEEYLNKLLSDPFQRGSYILDKLRDSNIRNQLSVKTFNGFFQDKSGDEGRGYLDISPIEDMLFKLYAFDKGYIPMPTLADRKTYPLLSGVSLPEFKYITKEDGSIELSPEIIDIFYNYAVAERNRIKQAWETLRKYSKEDPDSTKVEVDGRKKIISTDFTNLVELYHYKTAGGKGEKNIHEGLAYKYQIFSSFNKEGFDFDKDARREIEKILESHIKQTIEMSDNLGVTDNGMNQLLDSSLIERVSNEYNGNITLAIKHILGDYTIKTMISSMESVMLFSGDLAFYKDAEDYVKRLSVLTSSGALLRLNVPGEFEDNQYVSTTLSTPKFKSTYYDLLYKKQEELLKQKYPDKDQKFISDILKDNLKAYGDRKLDSTDAQVYLSPSMFREISIRRGNWSDDMQEAFELLNSTEPITPETEQRLLNVVLNPLKYVYFDRLELDTTETDKLLIPTYDKMSMSTLFRRYVVGTHMEDLLDRMEGKGQYDGFPEIHMVKYESAVKVGNRLRSQLISNPNTENQKINDLTNIATYNQNFRFLRHQVVTDPHDEQHTLLGTQAKKIGLANIVDDLDYNIEGKLTKGSEVKKNINDALSNLSKHGLTRLLDKLGVDNHTNIDEGKFRDLLYKEGQKAGLAENVLEGIRIGLSMDAMPERKWVYNRIISMINKETIDTYLPGNQLIQMSGYGLGLKDSKSIYDKTNDLKFIFDNNGKVKGIEAKVSISVFNDILPKELDTFEKKVEWLNDRQELLQGLGYRIPTQGQNSMVSLNIVQFLPEQLGDVIILPNEFTALTGSDFDIDKLFFVRYNYHINKEGEVVKVKSNLTGSEESIQNYLLDHYRGVLLSDNNFLSTSSPLGAITDRLKDLASLVTKAEKETKVPLLFASPLYQADVKYKYSGGKFGIGPEALNNVHHIMSQVANLSFNYNVGIGLKDEDGNSNLHGLYGLPEENGQEILISDWLSALIDSHVDIAKDPYIINLNVVRRTYNVINLLVRLGMGQKTFEFSAQPILKDLVEDSNNIDSSVSNLGGLAKWQKKIGIEKQHKTKWLKKRDAVIKKQGVKQEDLDEQLKDYKPFEDDLVKLITTPEVDRDALWYEKQLRILDTFKELDKGPAKQLNALVMASRVDTKKYGNNLIDVNLYSKSVKKLIRDNNFNNLDKLITLDGSKDSSFISTYYSNSVDLIQKLFDDKTITATDKFFDLIDDVLLKSGQKATDEESMPEIVNRIADDLYSAFVSRFFTDKYMMGLNSNQVKTILNNVNNFVLDANEKYPELKDNFLVQSLIKGRTTTEDGTVFLGIPNVKSNDTFVKEDLMFGWQELLNSNHPEVVKFGKELLIYSYYTSGFKKGMYSIYHYIPAKLLKEFQTKTDTISFDDHMRGLVDGLSSKGLSYIDELSNEVVDEVFRNNWYDPKYTFNPTKSSSMDITGLLKNKSGEPAVVRVSGSNNSLIIGMNKDINFIYRPFITVNVDNKEYLMEYIGYVPGTKTNEPIYKLTNKMGMYEKGRRIVEYGLDKSMLDSNKVTEITDEQVRNAISKEHDYDMYIYIEPENRVVKKAPILEATLEDISTSDINTLPTINSLNIEQENTLKSSLPSEVETLHNSILEAGIYSESEEKELIKIVDETPVESVEDLNKLIDKICNYVRVK